MHPLDNVVAHVHRINLRWHHLHAKCIFVTDGFEGLIPPTRSFHECRTDRFRRTSIHVIDDWFHCLANRRTWLLFLQTVSCDETLRDRFLNWCCEIQVVDPEIAGPRIESTGFESGRR